jgi:hypothetical protein
MANGFALKKAKLATRRGRVARELPSDLVEKRGVLVNRCKRLGWNHKDVACLLKANKEHLESEAGIAIELAGFDIDRWNFVKEAQIIYHRYHKANGVRMHPKCATIEMEPEYHVGGPDDGPTESLTPEQRTAMDVMAVSNWMRLDGQLTMYCQAYRSEFKQCVDLLQVAGPNFIKAIDMVLRGLQVEQNRAKRILRSG